MALRILHAWHTPGAVAVFGRHILGISYVLLSVLLILLSVASLIILARKGKFLPVVLALLQSLFVLLYVWQFM